MAKRKVTSKAVLAKGKVAKTNPKGKQSQLHRRLSSPAAATRALPPVLQYLSPDVPLPDEGIRGECEKELLEKLLANEKGLGQIRPSSELRQPRATTPKKHSQEALLNQVVLTKIADTTIPPWCWICRLIIIATDGKTYGGTGWLVGPRTVMTAGHNVYHRERREWARSIAVTPGCNSSVNPEAPFGTQTVEENFHSVAGWVNQGLEEQDYGSIILPEPFPGLDGTFGTRVLTDSILHGLLINVAGYPLDSRCQPYGTLWGQAAFAQLLEDQRIGYPVDTAIGMSGSPVWLNLQADRFGLGIHAYEDQDEGIAKATRINSAVLRNIKEWLV